MGARLRKLRRFFVAALWGVLTIMEVVFSTEVSVVREVLFVRVREMLYAPLWLGLKCPLVAGGGV